METKVIELVARAPLEDDSLLGLISVELDEIDLRDTVCSALTVL